MSKMKSKLDAKGVTGFFFSKGKKTHPKRGALLI